MKQTAFDGDWQRLQDNITDFFARHERGDNERIEYKPVFRIQLLKPNSVPETTIKKTSG